MFGLPVESFVCLSRQTGRTDRIGVRSVGVHSRLTDDVSHSSFYSARVLRLLLVERIKHGTATGRSLSCAKRGHLEQSLPHAL